MNDPLWRQWDGWTLGQEGGLNRQLAVRVVVGTAATGATGITMAIVALGPDPDWRVAAVTEAHVVLWAAFVLAFAGRPTKYR